jgi:hypothetical protein
MDPAAWAEEAAHNRPWVVVVEAPENAGEAFLAPISDALNASCTSVH